LTDDDFKVIVLTGGRVVAFGDFENLALGRLGDGVGNHTQDSHVAVFDQNIHGTAVKKIPYQDTYLIAPLAVGCHAAASDAGTVDHIVVQQGGRMHEFDGSPDGDGHASLITRKPGIENRQKRPQAFAPVLNDVLDHAAHEGNARM